MSQYNTAKQQVIDISRRMVAKGFLIGTGGNVSVRIPEERRMAITPSSYDYMKMMLDDVCIIDWEMAQIEGTRPPSIESALHAAIYENRPDVQVVIHTHQVSASAVALINRSIPALYDEQVRFLGPEIALVSYGPSGSEQLKNNIVRKLGNHCNAYIMKNHGALVLGSNPEQAMINAELLEKCSTAFLLAYRTGERMTCIPKPMQAFFFSKLRKEQETEISTDERGK